MNKCLLLAAVATATLGTQAQSLDREITVDRELKAVERESTMLPLLPTLTLPTQQAPTLQWSADEVVTVLNPSVVRLEPAPWQPAKPSRGYVMASIGTPAFMATASAGYRLVESAKGLTLDGWLNYDGDNFKRYNSWLRHNEASVGLRLGMPTGKTSHLGAALSYDWARRNIYNFSDPLLDNNRFWLTANRVDLAADWTGGSYQGLRYGVTAGYGYYGFNNFGHENSWRIGTDASLATGDTSWMTARLGIDGVSSDGSSAIITILPAWHWASDNITLKVGPRLDIDAGCGTTALHLAPEASLGWEPMSYFALQATAVGGQRLNTMGRMSLMTPRLVPWQQKYPVDNVPLKAGVRLTGGPWKGLSVSIFGDYAKAKQLAMPTMAPDADMWATWYDGMEVTGWHVGAELKGSWSRWATLSISAETASHGSTDHPDRGWIDWRDRARSVFTIGLTANPLGKLSLKADWQLRTGRRVIIADSERVDAINQEISFWRVDPLGNSSLLTLEARYAYRSDLTLWLRGENLLNNACAGLDLTPSQGIRALIGATFTFN